MSETPMHLPKCRQRQPCPCPSSQSHQSSHHFPCSCAPHLCEARCPLELMVVVISPSRRCCLRVVDMLPMRMMSSAR